jgi:hypothetical protein
VTRINLLQTAPVHRRKTQSSPDQRRGALACSVILTLAGFGLGWWGLTLQWHGARVDRELARTRQELARLRAVVVEARALELAARDIHGRIDLLDQLRGSQGLHVRVLDGLGRALPRDCWLTALTEDGSGGVRVEGRAPALSSLFHFVEGLERSGIVRGVEVLDSRTAAEDSGTDLVGFSLKASLYTPGAGGEPGFRQPLTAFANSPSPAERSR